MLKLSGRISACPYLGFLDNPNALESPRVKAADSIFQEKSRIKILNMLYLTVSPEEVIIKNERIYNKKKKKQVQACMSCLRDLN